MTSMYGVLSDCIPLVMSLQWSFFYTFNSSILRCGSHIMKVVAIKVALRNPFSIYCNNVLGITDQYVQGNSKQCHSVIVKN